MYETMCNAFKCMRQCVTHSNVWDNVLQCLNCRGGNAHYIYIHTHIQINILIHSQTYLRFCSARIIGGAMRSKFIYTHIFRYTFLFIYTYLRCCSVFPCVAVFALLGGWCTRPLFGRLTIFHPNQQSQLQQTATPCNTFYIQTSNQNFPFDALQGFCDTLQSSFDACVQDTPYTLDFQNTTLITLISNTQP